MALIDEMLEAQEDAIVGYDEFLKSCQPESQTLYCFVEAIEDEIYYSSVLTPMLTSVYEMFRCRNKDGVIRIYHLVKRNSLYRTIKAGFFVDKDFDAFVGNSEIFETPFYSIENFYSHLSCVQKVFQQQFGINRIKHQDDYESSVKLYIALRDQFHSRVLNLNAWLSCHADVRKIHKSIRINIDDRIRFQEIISPDLSKIIIPSFSFEEINQLFNTTEISLQAFNKKVEEFKLIDHSETFRGKFEIKFLVNFLKRFNDMVSKRTGHLLKERYSCTLQFKLENIITTLSSYAFIPHTLRTYIHSIEVK